MVIFDKKKHKYTNDEFDIEYISVTTLINSFKEEFDLEKQSKIVAEREGVSQDVIKERWNSIRTKACDFGTSVHSIVENFYKSGGVENKDDERVLKFVKLSKLKPKDVKSEVLLFNHEYRVAGTADIIVDNDNSFDVVDIKTNKNFRFSSKYNKTLHAPLNHMDECEYSIYALQVSTYAYLYHCLTGKKVGNLSLYWYNKEENEFFHYPALYLYQDVKNMLNTFKSRGFKKKP